MPEKEFITFDVKTGIKNIIGRDLITDDFIAIYELVKNSYDAYADYVTLTFLKDEIIIADNGKGMSRNDLKTKWFAVAYSAKKDGSEDEENEDEIKRKSHLNNSKSRRFFAGAKGVGRFSCDRLGNELELVSKRDNQSSVYKINVDWNQFEIDAKQSFGAIMIPMERTSEKVVFPQQKPHGTVLRIKQLNSVWDEDKMVELKRSLEKLINPFSKQDDFKIEIVANEFLDRDEGKTGFQKINGVINNSILKVLDIKTTQVSVKIEGNKITTKLIDRGNLIYHIEEVNKYKKLIDDLDVSLYFLNRSAKINFGKIMDIEPVNYGNIFLFKNGFRVQPYGNVGDDSWGLDKNKTQGYGRFLGSRELFGKVELITEKSNEFKEVSSRDGGLVETIGRKTLFEIFDEKALKRLERYVSGVLWGEGFKRKNYFVSEEKAEEVRKNLKDDKDKDSYEDIKSNLGSKIDFVNLIKSLSDDSNIKIVSYDKGLIDFVNEQLEVAQPKFIQDLERIAENTDDKKLLSQIKLTEKNFNRLYKEKEEAQQREAEERAKREAAEEKAAEEEKKRKEAEKKQREEEEKRRKAELEAERKEKERYKAEVEKLQAQEKARKEEEARKQAEKTAENRKRQLDRVRSAESITYKDLRDSNHIIGVYADDISKKIKLFKNKLDRNPNIKREDMLAFLQGIGLANEKIITITKFTTKSNYLQAQLSTEEDIVKYINNYIKNIYLVLHKELKIEIIDNGVEFIREFQPIELSVVLDNILSNSSKKSASKVVFEFTNKGKTVILSIRDMGKSLDSSIDEKLIFEEGITSTRGAGLGLSHVKRILESDFNATIEYNSEYKKGFELIIHFKR
ncbi:MAG: ATP-binding protein [Chitinophagaceae bacterium]